MPYERIERLSYTALRIVAGSMFTMHGAQKILGWFAPASHPPFGSQIWIGGVIELSCGVLIALGLLTRAAAFLASGTMAVAYVQFHWKLELAGAKWLPFVNKGELAALYSFVFLFIFARGPGKTSLDELRR